MWVPISVSSLLPDNDGTIIRTSNSSNPLYNQGYFLRQFSGPINVKWFGAKGDGTTDDTATVQAAINAAVKGTVYFPTGTYIGNFAAKHCNIIGDGYDSILFRKIPTCASLRRSFCVLATRVFAYSFTTFTISTAPSSLQYFSK